MEDFLEDLFCHWQRANSSLSHQYHIAVTSLLSSEIPCIPSCRNWVQLKARVNFKVYRMKGEAGYYCQHLQFSHYTVI
uniref:Uncharacterized protein n=1 Tax=Pyxicephalus adspersus TaxID=30357 RepID=A0AAV2ZV46_PYXAD|nr:TPA: hypothetical protein GDO54_003342 [Pyxicephalus adspersus]